MIGGCLKLWFPVGVRHAVRSLFASHQSTHKTVTLTATAHMRAEPKANRSGGNSDCKFYVLHRKTSLYIRHINAMYATFTYRGTPL